MANAWTSQRSGFWALASSDSASPWYDGGTQTARASVPANTDTVTIAGAHTVYFDDNQQGFAAGLGVLTVNGTLQWATSGQTYGGEGGLVILDANAQAPETPKTAKLTFDVVSTVNYLKTTTYGIAGAIFGGTAAWLTAAFNHFFNIETPTGTVNAVNASTLNGTDPATLVADAVDASDTASAVADIASGETIVRANDASGSALATSEALASAASSINGALGDLANYGDLHWATATETTVNGYATDKQPLLTGDPRLPVSGVLATSEDVGTPLQTDDDRLPETVIAEKADIPTDYQQRGAAVTLPSGVASTSDLATLLLTIEEYIANNSPQGIAQTSDVLDAVAVLKTYLAATSPAVDAQGRVTTANPYIQVTSENISGTQVTNETIISPSNPSVQVTNETIISN